MLIHASYSCSMYESTKWPTLRLRLQLYFANWGQRSLALVKPEQLKVARELVKGPTMFLYRFGRAGWNVAQLSSQVVVVKRCSFLPEKLCHFRSYGVEKAIILIEAHFLFEECHYKNVHY